MKKREFLLILLIVSISFLLHFYIANFLPLIKGLLSEPTFITDLLGNGKPLPHQIIILSNFGNIILIWYLGKKILNSQFGLLSALLYAISPWTIYLAISNSIYTFLLFYFLIIFIGMNLMYEGRNITGQLLLIVGTNTLLYSHLLMLFVVPILLIGIIIIKNLSLNKLKVFLVTTLIICLPLPFLMVGNSIGVNNILNNQSKVFSDVGLLNTVVSFQGESKKAGYSFISRATENKYIYLLKYAIFKSIKQIMPSAYFTSQERLLNFSFSPPIYAGFLIPFFYGLALVMRSPILRKYLLLSLILIIPSFLSKTFVDLNRLILFSPTVIFLISYGLIKIAHKEKVIATTILYLIIGLVLLQFIVTLFDINLREYPRYERFFNRSLNI